MATLIPNHQEAERIVLAIIQVNGGYYRGTTRLYKVFYDAHLYFWREHGRYLTTHPIVCMPRGPGIDEGKDIIADLIKAGKIKHSEQPSGPYTDDVYSLCAANLDLHLSEQERDAIRSAIDWVGEKTATAISHESHERSVTWREAKAENRLGAELHAYLDALGEEALQRHAAASQHAKEMLDGVFDKR